jgi:DNA-binding winged helix-turn-helix (wHTH) protein
MHEHPMIGAWRFDSASSSLDDGETRRILEYRAANTLDLLCRRRGEVVSKQEILNHVWQGRLVSGNSVAVVVADLRRALNDDAKAPRHIVTVAKRGYRLMPAEPAIEPVPTSVVPSPRRWWLACGAALCGVAAVGLIRAPEPPKPILLVHEVRNETGRPDDAALASSLQELVTFRMARVHGLRTVTSIRAGAGEPPELELDSRLIRWNGIPTLAMTASERGSGTVIWSEMAEGNPERIASATLASLDDLERRLRMRKSE